MPMGKDLPEVPVTAQHFLTYRLDGVSAAEGDFWIKRIPRPVLMIRDEGDMMVHDFEPNVLLAAARSGDSIVPRIEFVSLPNPKGLNAAGHSFADNQDKLVATVVEWLARL